MFHECFFIIVTNRHNALSCTPYPSLGNAGGDSTRVQQNLFDRCDRDHRFLSTNSSSLMQTTSSADSQTTSQAPLACRLVNLPAPNMNDNDTTLKWKSTMRIIAFNKHSDIPSRLAGLAQRGGWDVQYDVIEPESQDQLVRNDVNAQQGGHNSLTMNQQATVIGRGMNNLGNTCYVNSVLQALFHSPGLGDKLLRKRHSQSCELRANSAFCMHCAVEEIAVASKNPSIRSPISPISVTHNINMINRDFVRGRQECAHEFLVALRSVLDDENQQSTSRPTAIKEFLGGEIRSQIHCVRGNHDLNKVDVIYDLSLEIPRQAKTLEDCFASYFSMEHFDGDNTYNCEKCGSPVSATKQLWIELFPRILTVHLKRFTATGTKITRQIAYPCFLDLSAYSTQGQAPLFRLFAVLVHSGKSPHTGHYFIFVRDQSFQWTWMNDTSVQGSNERVALDQEAYMLFYEQIRETDDRSDCTTTHHEPILVDEVFSSQLLNASSTNQVHNVEFANTSAHMAAEMMYQLALARSAQTTATMGFVSCGSPPWKGTDLTFLTKGVTFASVQMLSRMALARADPHFNGIKSFIPDAHLETLCASKPFIHGPNVGPIIGKYWVPPAASFVEFVRDWQTSLHPDTRCTDSFIVRAVKVTHPNGEPHSWFVVAYEYGRDDVLRFQADITMYRSAFENVDPQISCADLMTLLDPSNARQKLINKLQKRRVRARTDAMSELVRAQNQGADTARHRRKRTMSINSDDDSPSKRPLQDPSPRGRTRKVRIISSEQLPSFNKEEKSTFHVTSDEFRKHLDAVLLHDLSKGMSESTCCVCDAFVLKIDMKSFKLNDPGLPLSQMQHRLKSPPNIPDALRQQYLVDCPQLESMVLSPRGCTCESGEWIVNMCTICLVSLLKKSRENKPPKFAICNGFMIGLLPYDLFENTTWVEKELCRLVQCQVDVKHLQGGAQRAIRSHGLTYLHEPAPPVNLLPRKLESLHDFKIVMSGPFTPQQKVALKHQHLCRKKEVHSLLEYALQNNFLYKDKRVDMARINEEHANFPGFVHDDTPDAPFNNLDDSFTTHRRMQVASTEMDENVVIQHDSGIFEVDPSASHKSQCFTTVVEEMTSNSTAAKTNTAQPSFIVRRSNVLLPSNFANIVAMLFFELFPFGHGGLDDVNRVVPVGRKKYFEHLLRLSSRRFAQHSRFLLYAFDHIGRSMCMTSLGLRCRLNARKIVDVLHMSAEDLADHCKHQLEYINDFRRGNVPLNSAPWASSVASQAMSFLAPSASKMWGSNDERKALQSKAFSLWNTFGQPTLFVTFNPHDVGSLTVCAYAGHFGNELVDLAHAPCHNCQQCLKFPTEREMFKLVAKDPFAAARYFDRVNKIFIKRILGWDIANEKPMDEGGLFGTCKAFFGSVETQGRGTLHTHYLIWIEGMPETHEQLQSLCEDPLYRDRLVQYSQSLFSNEYPITKHFQDPETSNPLCPQCKHALVLPTKATEMHNLERARQRPGVNGHRPWIAKCPNCKKSFDHERLFQAQCESLQAAFDINEIECNDEVIDRIGASVSGLDVGSDTSHRALAKVDVLVSKILWDCQTHKWTHTDSCFKRSARLKPKEVGNTCRFLRPHQTQPRDTHMDLKTLRLISKIPLGCEYLNAFIQVLTKRLKMNHDAQMVITSGPDVVYYALKYSTKLQQSLYDTQTAMISSLDKRISRDDPSDSRSNEERATGRYMSMLFGLTNRMEISAPLAAFYFLHDGPVYFSHRFSNLLVTQVKAIARGHDVNLQMEVSEAGSGVCPQVYNYIYRPKSLEHTCFHNFNADFDKVKLSERDVVEDDSLLDESVFTDNQEDMITGEIDSALPVYQTQNFRFLDGHPHVTSHGLRRIRRRVVNFMGTKLKDRSQLKSANDRNDYYFHVLVLFFPFRAFEEIGAGLSATKSSEDVFRQWECNHEILADSNFKAATKFMEFNDAYYQGKEHAKNAQVAMNTSDGDAAGAEHPEFAGFFENSDISDNDDDNEDRINQLNSLYAPDDDALAEEAQLVFNPDVEQEFTESLKHQVALEASADSVQASHTLTTADRYIVESLSNKHVEFIREFHKSLSSELTRASSGSAPTDSISNDGEHDADGFLRLPTTVELYDEAIADSTYVIGVEFVAQPKPVKARASLREVSQAHSLNKLQHACFKLLGSALLAELKFDAGVTKEKPSQVICYLGGAGGTGKSRVVKSLLALQQSWGQDGRIQVTAPTGIAAVLIEGVTIHSLLEFYPKNMKDSSHKQYSQEKVSLFSRSRILIIDEVSMLSSSLLAQIDDRLRNLCGLEAPFGGLHIVLAGDLCQLDPVVGFPVYSKNHKSSVRDRAGYKLWHESVNHCILLEENMRFLNDPEWGKVLESVRLGNWTDKALQIINSRLARVPQGGNCQTVSAQASQVDSSPGPKLPASIRVQDCLKPVIVVSNESRRKYNSALFSMCIRQLDETNKPIRILARLAKTRTTRTMTAGDFKSLYKLADNKTEKIPMILDLFVGAPVMFTMNDTREKKIANGSVGFVVGFEFPRSWQNDYVGRSKDGVFVPSCEPNTILVRILGKEGHQFHSDLPPGIFRTKRRHTTVRVTYPNRQFEFGLSGFPIRLAFAATTFKVQGLSLKDYIIADWTERGQTQRRGEAYVALSRGEVRYALHILQTFSQHLTDVFKPSDELLLELERLRMLHEITMKKLEQSEEP